MSSFQVRNGKVITKGLMAHTLVRNTAIEMAGALYDEIMKDNTIYAIWKAGYPALTPQVTEAAFLEMMWPKLCDRARATLAGMLVTNIDEGLKEDIADALVKDAQFVHARRTAEEKWRKKHGFGLSI